MPKHAISVTLEADNLLWLRGQARAAGRRSVSGTLDALIAEARAGRRRFEGGIRSVVGTIDVDRSDPGLDGADAAIRHQFDASSRTGPPRG